VNSHPICGRSTLATQQRVTSAGDKFRVLLADVVHPDDVERVADKLLGALSEPVALSGRTLFVMASLGIALYPRDAQDFETLFKHADSAMYDAKQVGRNNLQFLRIVILTGLFHGRVWYGSSA